LTGPLKYRRINLLTQYRGDRAASGASPWRNGVHLEGLANLAHELRTPVQVLLGYLEVLRDGEAGELGQEARNILERMNSNVHDLAQTIENVLEFAFVEANAQDAGEEDFDLEQLLSEVMALVDAMNDRKQLEIRVETDNAPRTIRSRRRLIRGILANLATNAVKFTSKGTVTIAIRRAAADRREGIELEVRDTGPGIRSELIAHAFEQFLQLSHAAARQYRGIGLGLSVVQRNVRMLGGSLEVATAPGQGSSFRITIPCAIVQPKGKGPATYRRNRNLIDPIPPFAAGRSPGAHGERGQR
jgi:signal transduction histidine kinase